MAYESSPWSETVDVLPITSLKGEHRTDVAIVGGGYTGLSTALHLAEKQVGATVLEANAPGWGGSGRNGGQVIPGLKYDPDTLEAKFGIEQGKHLVEILSHTVDDVFELCTRHHIECEAQRSGWIQAAHDAIAVRTVKERAAQWARRGVQVRILDKNAMAEMVGTDFYHGGWLDPRAANLNPTAYVRGLLRAAISVGAKVYGDSRVVRLERRGKLWRLHTSNGASLDADKVLLATNGYTDDLWPGLRQTMIAANSFQIATRALTLEQRSAILPGGQSVSDTRRVLRYFRLDAAGRLIMGGRGPFREPRGPADFSHLDRSIVQMFPSLKNEPIEHRWGGRVALTRDFLPHLHEPAPGILACVGYNGRGVGMATTMGRLLAEHLVAPERGVLPLPFLQIEPIPLHGLHTVYVSILIAWYRFLDGLGIG